MKLWKKKTSVNKRVEKFTISNDRELDLLLAEHDVIGSMAHAKMLEQVGLLKKNEWRKLHMELKNILQKSVLGKFVIKCGVEDVHSQVEFLLTKKLGEAGKKIHTARSRKDQVLLDIKLFSRKEIFKIVETTSTLFDLLISLSNTHKNKLLP